MSVSARIIAMVLFFVTSTVASASVIYPVANGNFETGLSGWSVSGGVATTVSSYTPSGSPATVFTPTDGNRFLRIAAGNLTTSVISTAFTLNQGDELLFDWWFDSRDYYNDSFTASLVVGVAVLWEYFLADVQTVGSDYTGWTTQSYTNNTAGAVTALLSFQVRNDRDQFFDSFGGVDNIRVVTADGDDILTTPAPAAAFLLAPGLLMLVSSRRRTVV